MENDLVVEREPLAQFADVVVLAAGRVVRRRESCALVGARASIHPCRDQRTGADMVLLVSGTDGALIVGISEEQQVEARHFAQKLAALAALARLDHHRAPPYRINLL